MHTPTLQASRKTKKTPVGEIPVNWGCVRFGEILQDKPEYGANASSVEFIEGKTPRYIRITDIDNDGGLIQSARVGLPVEFAKGYELADGDLLIARSGATVGKCFVYQKRYGSAVYAGYLIKFRIDEARCHLPFVVQWLRSPYFKKWIEQTNRAGAQPNINAEEYQSLLLPVPPLPEQSAIASILGTWDQELEQHKKLLEAKQELKQGLMQQLLTGKTRFREFKREPWRIFRIGSLMEECDRYVEWSDGKPYRFASIRRRSGGLFDRGTFYGREVKTKVLKLLRAGDFLISKRQVVHGAWGMVTKEFDGFGVSDEYDVLVNRDAKVLDMQFFNYLSQTRYLWHMAYLASNGVHIEKLIFNFDDFAKERVKIPPTVEEQAKIVSVLATCDREIGLLQKQLDALKEQKRGLMQKLLTGEIRVKV